MEALAQLSQVALATLKGVGPSMVTKLARIGLISVQDLLFHLPLRYEDRTRVTTVRDCLPGTHTNIIGEITNNQITHGKRRMLVVDLNDGTGNVQLCFFSFSASQRSSLSVGRTIRCYGEIKRGPRGLQIVHPEYRSLDDDRALTPMEETLTPVYPTTDGLKQISLRNLTDQALIRLQRGQVEELLPASLFDEQYSLAQALAIIHRPPPEASTSQLEQGKHPAQVRLIKEELLAHNLSMLKIRQRSDVHQAVSLNGDETCLFRPPTPKCGWWQKLKLIY